MSDWHWFWHRDQHQPERRSRPWELVHWGSRAWDQRLEPNPGWKTLQPSSYIWWADMQMHMHISHLFHFYLFWGDRPWDLRGSIGKLPGPIGPHGLERKSKVKSALQPKLNSTRKPKQSTAAAASCVSLGLRPSMSLRHPLRGLPHRKLRTPTLSSFAGKQCSENNKWRIYPNHRHKILNLTPDSCHHHHNHLHPDLRFGTRTFISLHTFGFCWQMSNEYFAEYFLNISQNIF